MGEVQRRARVMLLTTVVAAAVFLTGIGACSLLTQESVPLPQTQRETLVTLDTTILLIANETTAALNAGWCDVETGKKIFQVLQVSSALVDQARDDLLRGEDVDADALLGAVESYLAVTRQLLEAKRIDR